MQPSGAITQDECVAAPAVGQNSPTAGVAPQPVTGLQIQVPVPALQVWFVLQSAG